MGGEEVLCWGKALAEYVCYPAELGAKAGLEEWYTRQHILPREMPEEYYIRLEAHGRPRPCSVPGLYDFQGSGGS